MRAQYGTRLIREMSKALSRKHGPGFSKTNLERMRQFYTFHPIAPVAGQLKWTDYVELMPVRDEKTRKRLEARILKEGLKSKDIRRVVRRLNTSQSHKDTESHVTEKPLPPLKRPTGLKVNTFSLSPLKVKLKDGDVLIDCGFFVSWPVPKGELKNLDITDAMSYTYSALIDRVVDGDTLLVLIEVGFGIIVRDRLRLRGINCPEVSTPEGVKAKKFVEKLLPVGSTIVLQSHKCATDIYGRFVVDVFFAKTPGHQDTKTPAFDDASAIIKDGTYLNQLLLDEGHAERM
jgi:endonuclease YncB( thermonuclease family)